MDFSMDLEKINYIIGQYETVVDNLNQYVSDFGQAIDELSSGWEGLAQGTYYDIALLWMDQCNTLMDDITNLKEAINDNVPDASDLLDRGKNLEV